MKIKSIKVYSVSLPVVGKPYRMSHSVLAAFDSTLVEVETTTGITGYGECCPVGPVYQPEHALGARAALAEICPHLIGQNALEIDNVHRRMEASLNGSRNAKAAIDIALWDISGKAYGARVCDLLGGAVRERIPSYFALSVGSPEETARDARDKQAEGYPRLQMKVGGRPVEEDIAVIRKVAEVANPSVKLAAGANRSWSTRDAITLSRLTADINFIMEQPCNSYDEIAAIRPMVQHPIYLDECTEDIGVVLRAIGEGIADGFGLKVTRLGGITAMRTVRDICRARNIPHTCDDAWGGDIIAAACVHLAATVDPRQCDGAWIAAPYLNSNYDPVNGINVKNGWIDVPKAPGLGVVPDKTGWGSPVQTYG